MTWGSTSDRAAQYPRGAGHGRESVRLSWNGPASEHRRPDCSEGARASHSGGEKSAGLADFRTLANILNGKELGIQAATDEAGNVALFAPFDREVGGQLGANKLACGIEHMHLKINEDWTEKQMRAAAWCSHRVLEEHGIPLRRAILTPGDGFFDDNDLFHLTKNVGVQRGGHTSHKNVSAMIGSFQRTDPGPKFSFKHLYKLTRFFHEHHTFEGAPAP